jgi:3-dehydroquinate synthase
MGNDLPSLDAPFSVGFIHRLRLTRNAFSQDNPALRDLTAARGGESPRVVTFVDQGVADAWPHLPEQIERYAREHCWAELKHPIHFVPGGEGCKNDPSVLEAILKAIHDAKIDRQSYVLVIGGGAVLDVVGYAAATAHRGVRLLRVPTTTVSQADSGVGVKNGVNLFNKKNYLGTFSPPWAVVNDEALLGTLSDRDWRCGFAEAVKVGLVKHAALFHQVRDDAVRIRERDESVSIPIIRRSAELHLSHITEGGDPFELVSARPLDFGHWAAHKLEQMTNFELRHGEAVAVGLALDTAYSAEAGLLTPSDAECILECLADLGLPLYHPAMGESDVLFEGLDEFREHLGGRLTIALLKAIGSPVDVHEVDENAMRRAMDQLRTYFPSEVAQ